MFSVNEWDYPVYGTQLERRVSEFPSIQSATRSSANWLLLGIGYPSPQNGEWRRQNLPNGWTLLSRRSTRTIAAIHAGRG